jgi:hypothetical protein
MDASWCEEEEDLLTTGGSEATPISL